MYSIIQYCECIIITLTDVAFVTFSPSTSVRKNHLSNKYFLDFGIIITLTDVAFVTFSPSTSVRKNHLSNKYFLDFDTPSHIENEDIIKNIDIKIY